MDPTASTPSPKIFGILVTYRRPTELGVMLDCLSSQTRQIDHLIVVDNDPGPVSRQTIEQHRNNKVPTDYLPLEDNLGPAGGISRGMTRALAIAADEDWLLLLDDDDPPWSDTIVDRLLTFGIEMLEKDPKTALVGQGGARFNRRRGEIVRVEDAELGGSVPLDHITGNQFPLYRSSTIRNVGVFDEELFFGFEELEFGLRLRDSGYSIYALGPLWREARARRSHRRPSPMTLGTPSWRRYYSLRNLIYLLRKRGHSLTALRIALLRGIAKPLVSLPLKPSLSIQHLRSNLRAVRDGWTGRLGKQGSPDYYSGPVKIGAIALVEDRPRKPKGTS